MKDNAKIVYEVKEDGTHVEMRGESFELFMAVCRLAVQVKETVKIKDEADFYDLLIKGVKNADREFKLIEVAKKKESGEDVLSDLLDMLKEVLDA